jgi:hypothetical protein
MTSVWVVLKERYTEDGNSVEILGVYDYFGDAFERVNEVFYDCEEEYIETYGGEEEFVAENHNNGYAELHLDCGWDETIINAVKCDFNKSIQISI